MKRLPVSWGIVSLVVLITAAISSGVFESLARGFQSHAQVKSEPTTTPPVIKDTRDLSKYASVEYDKAPKDLSSDRIFTNKRYDNQGGWVVSTINNPRAAGIGRVTDDEPPPLFPINDSALVIVGEITDVSAFLSNDKSGVYSEFTIQVNEVIKKSDDGKNDFKKVTADRAGGVVIYPGGQRIMYGDSALGLPKLGSKYLFFLKRDDESKNYAIITSYELDGSRPQQMEMGRNFDEFKNVAKTAFIETVRMKIASSSNQ